MIFYMICLAGLLKKKKTSYSFFIDIKYRINKTKIEKKNINKII